MMIQWVKLEQIRVFCVYFKVTYVWEYLNILISSGIQQDFRVLKIKS